MSGQFQEAQILFSEESLSLSNGSSLQTPWIDYEQVGMYQISVFSDASGLTFQQESSTSHEGSGSPVTTNSSTLESSFLSTFPARERYIRVTITNNTGSAITNVKFQIKALYTLGSGASVFPLYVSPLDFSPALLTQSVSIGQDTSGVYRSTQVNQAGALLTSDFGTEVARGLYDGYSIDTKFGRNPEIDTNSDPEDMWNGGSLYTGFNATNNENIEVFSASANDSGSLVSSGTATGGSSLTIEDSSATFISDGVVVGDLVINDTQSLHGVITSVDSETQLTVFRWTNGKTAGYSTNVSDNYRIATTNGTGAAVVLLSSLLNEEREEQPSQYVILNGTSPVTVTGDYVRCPRCRVIIAGSSELNEGQLTVRQETTTANVFCIVPTFGQSTIGCFTVPKGKIAIIKRVHLSITRNNGSLGSATIALNTREFGGAWNGKRVFELNTSAPIDYQDVGGIVLSPANDVKFTIEQVSDNNTIAEGAMEYFLIDEN